MDFFAHQEQARRLTFRLVILFGLAVIGIILTCYFLAAFALAYAHYGPQWEKGDLWDPILFMWVTFGISAIVGLCSGFKILQLRGGGKVIAEELGGRLLSPSSVDPVERKILNIVEEMAIASGVPTPAVYMMDREPGINAFAAGYTIQNAVIAVTRGCVEQLSRDELQGVIAHEFSHILNGDMRINIHLMGVLFGILIIGMMGYYAFRMTPYRTSKEDRTGIFIIIIGLGLVVIGSIGTFFGNLIKAAVSRQREFLADASAVQFTRNPEGIAGALKKIAGYKNGSAILNPNAPEASHMFFAKGVFEGLFATHPPIDERIRRLDKSWEGSQTIEKGPSIDSVHSFFSNFSPEPFRSPQEAPEALLHLLQTDASIQHKIGAIHLAMPALSSLSPSEYLQFKSALQKMIHRDQKVDLSEWLMLHLIRDQLEPKKQMRAPSKRLLQVNQEATFLFTLMQEANEKKEIDVSALEAALQSLDQLIPPHKKQFLEQLSRLSKTPLQQELLAAFTTALHCPLPL